MDKNDFDTSLVPLMDDEIREELHTQGFETEEEFLAAYQELHKAKYGKELELN